MSGIVTLAFEISELHPALRIGIPVVGVLLITMSMMMGIRKKRRRSQAQGTARDRVEELKQRHEVRGDLEQLMVEIEQLAKRFGAQLDAKTVQMERLIDEADRKISELKQIEQSRQDASKLQQALASPFDSQTNQPPPPNPQSSTPGPQSSSPDDALKRSVYNLAEQGHAPPEIARKLDEHVGKIELILALRKP
jgi:TolA-binding protein